MPEILREIVCPDGTQFTVYTDGTWTRETWDGSAVTDSTDSSTTPEEVLAKLGAASSV